MPIMCRHWADIFFVVAQDNVQVNRESVQCIAIAYSEVRITEISQQLSRVDPSG